MPPPSLSLLPRLPALRPASTSVSNLTLRTLALTPAAAPARPFTSSPLLCKFRALPQRRIILDTEIEEKWLHGSGPGGQKINKTSSAVQLKHIATGLVIKCQETRSRTQNRKIAREVLGEKLMVMEMGDQSRTVLKAQLKIKRKKSSEKKKKRKYRGLEAKAGEEGAEEEDGEEGEEDVEEDVIEEEKVEKAKEDVIPSTEDVMPGKAG